MADVVAARANVRVYLGSDDFELREFPEGWRVVRPIREGFRGASTLVVERSTGAVLEFASGVPPLRIERSFGDVRSLASVIPPSSQQAT